MLSLHAFLIVASLLALPNIASLGILSPLLFIPIVVSTKSWKDHGFSGSHQWLDEKELCRGARSGLRNGLCHVFNDNLFFRKVEIVSEDPIIVVYRSAINRKLTKRLVMSLEKENMKGLKILGELSRNSEIRRANGTWMPNYSSQESMELYFALQRLLLPLDLRSAEPFQIFHYEKGGFYVPDLDIINEKLAKSHNMKMPWTRIATAIVSLKRAKRGGGLTFPYLSSTVMLNPGDVVLFFNETPDKVCELLDMWIKTIQKVELLSTHASCPVLDGEKLGATLWINSIGNELRALSRFQSWDLGSLLMRRRSVEASHSLDEKIFEIAMMNYPTYFDGQHHRSSEEIIREYREREQNIN